MMNVYNGNVTLGARWRARWSSSRTTSPPSTATTATSSHRSAEPPRSARRGEEVKDNRFTIAGGVPGLEVSWQVTGIRQDDYAKAHPIVVEEPKSKLERGTRSFVPPGSSAKLFDPLAPLDPA